MVPQTGIRQRQERRRKEHSLIIGMRNQQADSLIPELWKPRFRDGDSVQPARNHDEREGQDGYPFELHGCAWALSRGEDVFEVRDLKRVACLG